MEQLIKNNCVKYILPFLILGIILSTKLKMVCFILIEIITICCYALFPILFLSIIVLLFLSHKNPSKFNLTTRIIAHSINFGIFGMMLYNYDKFMPDKSNLIPISIFLIASAIIEFIYKKNNTKYFWIYVALSLLFILLGSEFEYL